MGGGGGGEIFFIFRFCLLVENVVNKVKFVVQNGHF